MYDDAGLELRRHLQKPIETSIYEANLSDLNKTRVKQLTEVANSEVPASDTTNPRL